MAASSPYQTNDYQAVSTFRPYQLPINDIFKTKSALDEQWTRGAMRIKDAYQNALDLNLVTDENKQRRDLFMQSASKEIAKLNSMNLGDISVQRKGLSIFSPLMRDEDIAGEDFVVGTLNKEISKGLSTRTMDGGKQFNPLSIENLQIEKSFLSSVLNRKDGWRSIVHSMSSYTPNHDIAAEYKKIQDLVTAQEQQEASLKGGWYIETLKQKGVSKERLALAIEEMGSPQLKQAMRVEGRNAYYKVLMSNPNNPAAVDDYFKGLAANQFDRKIADIKNNRAELQYKLDIIPNTPENTALKNSYKAGIEQIDENILNLETVEKPKYVAEFQNLGNLKYLSSNVQKVERLWQSAKVTNVSEGLAYNNTFRDIKVDNAKIAQENINVARERINLGYNQLKEEQRQFDEREKRLWFEAVTPKPGSPGSSASGLSELTGAADASNSGWVPTLLSPQGPGGRDVNSEVAREGFSSDFEQKDKIFQNSAMKLFFGENIPSLLDKPDGTKLDEKLYDNNIEDAASLITSYLNKNKLPLPTTQITPFLSVETIGKSSQALTQETVKGWLKNASPSQFRKIIGDIISKDVDFASDWMIKKTMEADPSKQEEALKKAIQLKASYSEKERTARNISETMFSEQKVALGDLSKYFDNEGKVPMTEENITKAYERYSPPGSIWVNDKNTKSIRLATPEEAMKYNSNKEPKVGNNVYVLRNLNNKLWKPSEEAFKNTIRSFTDPIALKYYTNTNQLSKTYTFDNKTDKLKEFENFKSIVQPFSSDNNENVEKVLNFVKNNINNFNGITVYTPSSSNGTPTAQISMVGLKEDAQKMWERYSSELIPISPKNQEAYQTTSLKTKSSYNNAWVYTTKVSTGLGTGEIGIQNQSVDPNSPYYHVQVKNLFQRGVNNDPIEITSVQFRKMIEKSAGRKLEQLSVEELGYYASQIAVNIELNNKFKMNK